MKTRADIIEEIIFIEGGYTNNPYDSGGETAYGITKEVARAWGYNGPMDQLPKDVAREIYTHRYWNTLSLQNIYVYSDKLAYELFEQGVNCGVHRAGTHLQVCLNILNNKQEYYLDIAEDGYVGNATLLSLQKFYAKRGAKGTEVLLKMLNSLQGALFIDLAARREKDQEFLYGWFRNRIEI